MSGYSYDGYLQYLDKRGVNDPSANADFIENSNRYMQSKKNIRQGKLIRGGKELCHLLFKSKYYRPHILKSVKIFLILKFTK